MRRKRQEHNSSDRGRKGRLMESLAAAWPHACSADVHPFVLRATPHKSKSVSRSGYDTCGLSAAPIMTEGFHSEASIAAPTNPHVCLYPRACSTPPFPNVPTLPNVVVIYNQRVAIVIRSVPEGRLADTTKVLVLSLSHLRLHTPAENIRKLRC